MYVVIFQKYMGYKILRGRGYSGKKATSHIYLKKILNKMLIVLLLLLLLLL